MNKLKKWWSYFSYLGVDQSHEVYRQKSVALLNKIAFALLFFFTVATILAFKKFRLPIIGYVALSNALLSLLVIVFQRYRLTELSVFVLSFFIPVSLVFSTAYAKSIGITANTILYLAPRIIIILGFMIPVLMFGYRQLGKMFMALIPGILVYLFYDKIHILFGVNIAELPFEQEYYPVFVVMIVVFAAIVVALIIFLQSVNAKYESMLEQRQHELISSEEELKQQNEEIITINNHLQEQNEVIIKQKEKLTISKRRFKNIANFLPEILFEIDNNLKITFVNKRFYQITGYNNKDFLRTIPFEKLLHENDRNDIITIINDLEQGDEFSNMETKLLRKDGTSIDAMLSLSLRGLSKNEGFRGLFVDITEQVEMREQLQQLYTAVNQSANSIVITDVDGNIQYVNPSFTKSTGYLEDEVLGQTPRILKSGHHTKEFYEFMWQTIEQGTQWHGEIKNKRKDGTLYWEQTTIAPVITNGQITNYIAIKEDVTDRKKKNDELKLSYQLIEKKNKDITDSINYAKLIQQAILPPRELLHSFFNESFIINKPRDIVNGDFYYFTVTKKYFVLVVADCTGHGVPGGFMTMLGLTLLDEVTKREDIRTPADALFEMRKRIIGTLSQEGKRTKSKDGMDMALCIIDMVDMTMQYAGANRPLYMIRDNELQVTKPDKMPIGLYYKNDPYTNHRFQLQQNDKIYLFTDGLTDQFGGEKNSKIKVNGIQNIILESQDAPMQEQKDQIISAVERWQGFLKQTDDMLMVGVKI